MNYQGVERRTAQPKCIDHENRIVKVEEKIDVIDSRQEKIYVKMFGPNGDPKLGYVWKMEQLLDWALPVKDTAIRGARAAIWLFFTAAVSAIGWVIYQVLKHMILTGWKP